LSLFVSTENNFKLFSVGKPLPFPLREAAALEPDSSSNNIYYFLKELKEV
jgi:hypothetical protein